MRPRLAIALSSSLALLPALHMGCSAAQTAGSAAMASVTGGVSAAPAAMPDMRFLPQALGQAASAQTAADDDDTPDSKRPPRPVNPDLLAQRAKLQALRTNSILGKSRALMHNPDLDEMRAALRPPPED